MSSLAAAESMPDRRSWWIAPPNSPISALSLRIFRGRGSSTATLGTLDRFRGRRPVVRLQPFLDIEHAFAAAKSVTLANEGDHPSPHIHQLEGCFRTVLVPSSSHSGRRTFITNTARKISTVGGSLRDVQMLVGHTNLRTTQRYIEANPEAQVRIVELV
jgi:hypothetical protein